MAWVVRAWLVAMVAAASVTGYGLLHSPHASHARAHVVTPAVLDSRTQVVERAQVFKLPERTKARPLSV